MNDFQTNERQTIDAHRLSGADLIAVETSAFERGYQDYAAGRLNNPFSALHEPDAYDAWNLGQDAAEIVEDV